MTQCIHNSNAFDAELHTGSENGAQTRTEKKPRPYY